METECHYYLYGRILWVKREDEGPRNRWVRKILDARVMYIESWREKTVKKKYWNKIVQKAMLKGW